eukprot:scaffold9484_cov124-Isochrysis_galbana.AAC.4
MERPIRGRQRRGIEVGGADQQHRSRAPGAATKARRAVETSSGGGGGGDFSCVSKPSFRRAASSAACSACFCSRCRTKLGTSPSASSKMSCFGLPASGLGERLSGRILPSTMVCFRASPKTAFT